MDSEKNRRESPVSRETRRILDELKLEISGLSWERKNTQGIVVATASGPMLVPNTKEKGTADFKVTMPGRIVWLETKRPKGGVQSPHQIFFEFKVKSRGEEYYLITHPTEQIRRIILNDTRN